MANEQPTLPTTPAVVATGTQVSILRKWFIRMMAFLTKEVNEMRRQPKLLLSLVGGPFLVLLIFGATFQDMRPNIETVLVLPEGGVTGLDEEQIRRTIGLNFTLVDITTDQAAAEARLETEEIDLVQIVPADVAQRLLEGESSILEFKTRAIDPTVEAWIQYLSYAEVNEVNKYLLRQQAENAQQEALELRIRLNTMYEPIAELRTALSPEELANAQQNIRDLREQLTAWERLLPPVNEIDAAQESQVGQFYESIQKLKIELLVLEASISAGSVRQQAELINMALTEVDRLQAFIDIFVEIPPERIVSPIQPHYENLRGGAFETVIFHAPGVLALLIQHVAVNLGALALVRERLSGTFELFRVAPLNSIQILVGKYLGYTFFVSLTSTALVILMRLINIPLEGSVLDFAGLLLLITVASLGIGFLISLISDSDRQAIQYTMLVLLLLVFFSGIFPSLEAFLPAAQYISNLIPMTHAVRGFLSVMLSGSHPDAQVWFGLSAITGITFLLVLWLTQRAFRRA